MKLITGTYSIQDLLRMNQQPIVSYDPEALATALQQDNASHQRLLNQMIDPLIERTTEVVGPVPSPSLGGRMIRVNEDGAVQTRKAGSFGQQNYPLDKFQHGQGFTQDYLLRRTPADLAKTQAEVQRVHINTLYSELRLALFSNTERVTRDRFGKGEDLVLRSKPLANGDGSTVAGGPNGEEFDGTHSHYMATADLTPDALSALVGNVAEHGDSGEVQVWISRAEEAAIKALPGFAAYLDSRTLPAVLLAGQNGLVGTQALNTQNSGNRAIGVYEGAEIHVKPWMPAGYLAAVRVGAGTRAFRMRVSDIPMLQGLRLAGGSMAHPLEAKYWEDYFGIAAHDRTAAAVLQLTAGTYTVPAGL